jgi:outer membrane protein TolC
MRTLILLLLLSTTAWADPLSLEELQSLALQGSPHLAAARASLDAAEAKAAGTGSLPDPKLSWGHFFSSVETRLGPQREKFTLSQSLPLGGKLGLARDAADQLAEAEAERLRSATLELRFEIEAAYLRQAYLAAAAETARQDLELLRGLEKVTERKLSTAASRRSDLLRLQMEIAREEERPITFNDAREVELFTLAALVGETSGELPELETIIPDRRLPESLSAHGNAGLGVLEREIASREILSNRANKNGLPDLMLSLSTILTDELDGSLADDNGRDPWMVSVSVNLPIWRGSLKAERQAAAAQVRLSQLSYKDKFLQLEADLESLMARWREAHRKLELNRDELLPRADEILSLSKTDYSHGRISFDELLRTRLELLKLRLAGLAAQRDREIARAAIFRLTGLTEGDLK